MLQAEVEWAQHFRVAQMVGVTADEARAIRDGDFTAFTPAEQAAIAFAEAVETRRVTDAVWTEAATHFSQRELLDLVMVAGFYGYASRITMALDVQVDAGLTRIAQS
jgi:alkylhydroperoxidase family enzyme